jgi:hypothetical protein
MYSFIPDNNMFSYLKKKYRHFGIIWIGIFFLVSVFLFGYTACKKGTSYAVDSLELNSFIEPGFPFISTSIDARKLGAGFPNDNIAARTLALPLGDSVYVCFDTDLLRWSVAWTGNYLPMVLMAILKSRRVPIRAGHPANLIIRTKFHQRIKQISHSGQQCRRKKDAGAEFTYLEIKQF